MLIPCLAMILIVTDPPRFLPDDNTAPVAGKYVARVLFVKKRRYGPAYQKGLGKIWWIFLVYIFRYGLSRENHKLF